jgi:hypothetical protein
MWFLPAWSDLFYKFGETKIALFVALSLIYSEINLYNPIMDCIEFQMPQLASYTFTNIYNAWPDHEFTRCTMRVTDFQEFVLISQ